MHRLLFPAIALLAAGATAQTLPTTGQLFGQYISSAAHFRTLQRLAVDSERELAPACGTVRFKSRVAVWQLAPVGFAGNSAHPTAGLWQERVSVERCGTLVLHNYLFSSRPGLPPQALPLAPGRSQADPRLQRDLFPALALASGRGLPDCADIRVTDTLLDAVTTPPQNNAKGQLLQAAWRETWMLRRCDATVRLTVDFKADGKGGIAYDIH